MSVLLNQDCFNIRYYIRCVNIVLKVMKMKVEASGSSQKLTDGQRRRQRGD